MTRSLLFSVGLGLAVSASLFTVRAADLGSPAAPLEISEWIKGGPVSLADGRGKTVYVVEFWATWCPPCRTSIPHLTELQKKFKSKNVVVIGISDETTAKVKPFVEKMGDQMDYVVALDNQRKTSQGYMAAFQQNGIPHAFIVDQQGRVVWHGHPMAGLDEAVDQVVQGKFDMEKAKKAAQIERNLQQYLQSVSQDDKDPQAAALGKEILDSGAATPSMLNEFAWIVLTHPRVKHRDVPLALRAAKMAYDDTKGKDFSITDTYARALFDSGNKDEAIRLQKEAIAACQDADQRKQLEKTLQEYQAPARPAPATK